MKKIHDNLICYEYSSPITTLLSKIDTDKFYHEYLIDYHDEHSFSIGVERLGHSSGRWYEATIEKSGDSYLIKGKLVVLPKKEKSNSRLNITRLFITVLMFTFLLPIALLIALGDFISWVIRKIKKDPFASNDPEKRLDYFMIHYLGCKKMTTPVEPAAKNDIDGERRLDTLTRYISEKERKYYTHMLEILMALDIPRDYKWLITDVEAYPSDSAIRERLNVPLILTNEELIEHLKHEDFQWIWAVFLLFHPDISCSEILKGTPSLYYQTDLFFEVPVIQHPLAVLEIDAIDSTYVMMTSKDETYLSRFKTLFPKSDRQTTVAFRAYSE